MNATKSTNWPESVAPRCPSVTSMKALGFSLSKKNNSVIPPNSEEAPEHAFSR